MDGAEGDMEKPGLENGHAFDEIRGVCVKCGMAQEQYDDGGKPRCTGQMQPQGQPGGAVPT